MTKLPAWLDEAMRNIGMKEVATNSHPKLSLWKKELNVEWLGNVAWCGIFIAHCLQVAGKAYPKEFYKAISYSEMKKLDKPAVGAIGIWKRKGGNHVAFCVGKTANGIVCCGGNQGDGVNLRVFQTTKNFIGWYWPSIAPLESRYVLPEYNLVAGALKLD